MTTQSLTRVHHTVSGLDCAYAVFGDMGSTQTPVIALHGWGASAELMMPLGKRLAASGFRIIAPDLPGFGESTPPPTAWSVHEYADHVIRLLDTLEIPKAHLFGHSFGGRLAIILGARHPDRVASIVLANSAGVPPRIDPVVQLRTTLYKGMRDGLKAVGLTTISNTLREWYIARYASPDYKNAGVLRESFVKIVNESLLSLAAQVTAPTLLIWGAKDQDTPLWQGQKLLAAIPNAGIVVYDDAGHYSYLDRLPDVVATLVYFYKHPTTG